MQVRRITRFVSQFIYILKFVFFQTQYPIVIIITTFMALLYYGIIFIVLLPTHKINSDQFLVLTYNVTISHIRIKHIFYHLN